MLAFDTETEPFGNGNKAPRMVCMSVATPGAQPMLFHHSNIPRHYLETQAEQHIIVGHNTAYDMTVYARRFPDALPAIFDLYFKGRIQCTMLRQQLIDNAEGNLRKGGYALAALVERFFNRKVDKTTWRTGYAQFYDVPCAAWPQGAIDYALGDAQDTLALAIKQDESDPRFLIDAAKQAAYAFAYQLLHCWGMRTDARRVYKLRAQVLMDLSALRKELEKIGLLKIKEKGKHKGRATKNLIALREAVAKAYNGNPPRTTKGHVATSSKVLEDQPGLALWAKYVGLEKLYSTYIKVLEQGISEPIHAEFHMLASGRRGANKNAQTLPKSGGVRECYRPRRGFVFGAVDYDTLELRCWAQIMVNWFQLDAVPLARLYQDDPDADPHTAFGAQFYLKKSYAEGLALKAAGDKDLKLARQRAKAANFGLPGGMGLARFMGECKKYGYEIDEHQGREIIKGWRKQWNADKYFNQVALIAETHGFIEQHFSERVRGGLGYCDTANGYFQGLAADGCCSALLQVVYACYVHSKDYPALFGSRVVNSVHDELLCELPEDRAQEAVLCVKDIMERAMSHYCPAVPIRASVLLMDRWVKEAPAGHNPHHILRVT